MLQLRKASYQRSINSNHNNNGPDSYANMIPMSSLENTNQSNSTIGKGLYAKNILLIKVEFL